MPKKINLSRNHFNLFVPVLFLATSLMLVSHGYAVTIRIDQDGSEVYSNLDSLLVFINSDTANNTDYTIIFSGNNQHTYDYSMGIHNQESLTFNFTGESSDPSEFPVLRVSQNVDLYQLHDKNNVHYKNIIFQGPYDLKSGQNADYQLTFRNCIFSGFTSEEGTVFLETDKNKIISFANCIFSKNDTALKLHFWGNGPKISIINCIFDENDVVFATDLPDNEEYSLSVKNTIFVNNPPLQTVGNLKLQLTNILSSDASYISGCSNDCILESDPGFVSDSRSQPNDWKLKSTSKAIDAGDSAGAPPKDFGGNSRYGQTDIGVWEFQKNSVKLGYELDNIIPASKVVQATNGTGEITVKFKARDPEGDSVKLANFRYTVDGSEWDTLNISTGALPADWSARSFASGPDYGQAPEQSFIFDTKKVSKLKDSEHAEVKLQFKGTSDAGKNYSTVTTAPFRLDNKPPTITWEPLGTINKIPPLKGGSDEVLKTLKVILNQDTLPASIDQQSWEVPDDKLPVLAPDTYDITITATDLFGNSQDTIFPGGLQFDTSALKVTVHSLKTSLKSPRFTGTVSHANAKVEVEIGKVTKGATIEAKKWWIPPNTFLNLSPDKYIIIARVKLGDKEAVDTAEVTILASLPRPRLQDPYYTNMPQPEIKGEQDDWEAEVIFYLKGKEYPGDNQRDGTILLPAGSLPKLEEGQHTISVTTKTIDGSKSDTALLIIDSKKPEAIKPIDEKVAIKPTLKLAFNEKISVKKGSVRLFREGTKEALQTISADSIKILSDSVAQIISHESLAAGSGYYVLVDSNLFSDLAGNFYPGISDTNFWRFRTMKPDEPVIDSITSDSNALLGAGDSIYIKLHFNVPLTLDNGGMLLVLNTGGQNKPIPVPSFSQKNSVEVKYVVQRGDAADALEVQEVRFEGNGPVNAQGKTLVRNIGGEAGLSSRYTIRVDGIAPVVTVISPKPNTSIISPSVEYELSEDVKKGFIVWTAHDNSFPYTEELADAELKKGSIHSVQIAKGTLLAGRSYSMKLTVSDSAENSVEYKIDTLKLVSIQSFRLVPADTVVNSGDLVHLNALGEIEGETVSLTDLDWDVSSTGYIDANGVFVGYDIGKYRISAQYESMTGSTNVYVDSLNFTIDKKNGDTIQVSPSAKIIVSNLDIPAGNSNLAVLPDSMPEGIQPAGPALEFSRQDTGFIALADKVTLRFRPDTNNIKDSLKTFIRAYYKKGARWYLYNQQLKDGWFEIETDTLSSYLIGIDTEAPKVTFKDTTHKASFGNLLKFSWQAEDNIANPSVNLRLFRGGVKGDTVIPLIFDSGREEWYSISGGLINERGLCYRVEINDGVSERFSGKQDVSVTLPKQTAPEEFKNKRYDMISFPLNVEDRSVGAILQKHLGQNDKSQWRLYDWQGEDKKWVEMEEEDAVLQSGRAYWLQTRINKPVTFSLDSGNATLPVSNPFKLPLQRGGWHCIANPFLFNIPVSWLELNKNESLEIFARTESGWKRVETALSPWQGYVLKTSAKNELTIHPTGRPDSSSNKTENQKDAAKLGAKQERRIMLSVQNGPHRDGILEAGFGFPECSAGKDRRDLPKPPLPEQLLDISFEMAWSPETPFLTDYRGKLGDGQNWRIGVRSKTGGVVRLIAGGKGGLPLGMDFVLFDRSRGRVLQFSSDKVSYAAEPGKRDVFELAIGTKDYLAEQTAIFLSNNLKFSLLQNRPNPMRRSAVIEYSLPWSNGARTLPVSLFVYNGKGRLVKKLVDGTRSPGWHKVAWRGLDERGEHLPAGLYLYRLECGKFEHVRKLLLLP